MPSARVFMLLAIDLTVFLSLLLVTAYFGVIHIMLLVLGIILFLLAFYDYRYGQLSALLTAAFKLPASQGSKAVNRVPVFFSLGLIIYGFISLFKHGLVNTGLRDGMQGGQFGQVAFWAAAGTLLVIIVAIWLSRGAKK